MGEPPRIAGRTRLVEGEKYHYDQVEVRSGAGRSWVRQFVAHPGAVVVVPVLDDGRLVMIRNYRVVAAASGGVGAGWVLEFCAGTLDKPGEAPGAAAGRELLEETGYRAERVEPLLRGDAHGAGFFYTTPGLTDERMYPFAARGLTLAGQRLEPDETIEVVVLSGPQAWNLASQGGRAEGAGQTLMDAKSIVALALATRAGLVRM